ncbi:hypothetical protein AVEN_238849-1 [Araneus ventricosus]|uniref:Uncharacterized protein n=1 Tax=Araneus ventricosus TaxID=182803 RepID=A0A4Y2EP49_ARAVE|nr:hypothetical protein AVEN_238849-1 [Araneus ventricosus]
MFGTLRTIERDRPHRRGYSKTGFESGTFRHEAPDYTGHTPKSKTFTRHCAPTADFEAIKHDYYNAITSCAEVKSKHEDGETRGFQSLSKGRPNPCSSLSHHKM